MSTELCTTLAECREEGHVEHQTCRYSLLSFLGSPKRHPLSKCGKSVTT